MAISFKRIVIYAEIRGFILVVLLMIFNPVVAATQLTIHIEGFENSVGRARIVLFDSAAGYQGNVPPIRIESMVVSDRQAKWSVTDLAAGSYAAIVHHDKNVNEELDRPWFSLPLEQYGYTNNVFKTFGLPDYEQVKFTLGAEPVMQTIRIQYNPIARLIMKLQPYANFILLMMAIILLIFIFVPLGRRLRKNR